MCARVIKEDEKAFSDFDFVFILDAFSLFSTVIHEYKSLEFISLAENHSYCGRIKS